MVEKSVSVVRSARTIGGRHFFPRRKTVDATGRTSFLSLCALFVFACDAFARVSESSCSSTPSRSTLPRILLHSSSVLDLSSFVSQLSGRLLFDFSFPSSGFQAPLEATRQQRQRERERESR